MDSGDGSSWQARNGELVVHAKKDDMFQQCYLLTERDCADFRLRFQFQRGSDFAKSGVALRAVPCETARNSRPDEKRDWAFHLTVWIGKAADKDLTGGLWWSPPAWEVDPLIPTQLAEVRPIGEWNDMEIDMRGQSLRVTVNGRVIQDVLLNQVRPPRFPAPGLSRYSGRLGFLKRAGEVRFRKIEIEELRPLPTKGEGPGAPAPGPLPTMANSVGMRLILIPAGEFLMGSPDGQGDSDERPRHPVHITRPFYLGKYEVTQGQYQAVMNENPSQFRGSAELPVENLTWIDAIRFCNKLSELERRTPYYRIVGSEVTIAGGDGYRLPTEAEWEYAARAGNTTLYPSGDDSAKLGAYAWFDANSGRKTHLVGRKLANAWGLRDMVGNVWEWCGDWADANYYASSPKSDPPGPAKGSERVIRGSGWFYGPGGSRPGDRWWRPVSATRFGCLGFRVALSPGSSEPPAVRPGDGDPDRRAVESVLSLGGTVTIREAGSEREIKPGDRLPVAPFKVMRINVDNRPDLLDWNLEPIRGLSDVVEIWLSRSRKITDAGLERLSGLKRLEVLTLQETQVTDAGLAHLEGSPSLRHLDLWQTRVSNAGIASLGRLGRLEWLNAGTPLVTGAALAHLRHLPNLRHLTLWDQPVTDADLAHLEVLGQLESLDLVGLQVTDAGLAHLKGLTRLRHLNLYHSGATGRGLEDPRGLAQLRSFSLRMTAVTDADLTHLRNLPLLERLDLMATAVTDAGLVHLVASRNSRDSRSRRRR